MRLCAPHYVRRFHCIAERCRHSCCIGWYIGVDDHTLARWRALPGKAADPILATVDTDGDGAHLCLGADGRCPHLDARGLCRLITAHGEGILPDICREHPRFYLPTPDGAMMGIGAVCEEAARLILESDGYARTVDLGAWEGDTDPATADAIRLREALYCSLSERTVPYSERLREVWRAASVDGPPAREAVAELLDTLEYLDPAHRALFHAYTEQPPITPEGARYAERFLAYLLLRHLTPASTEAQRRCALRLCCLVERLFASLVATGTDPVDAARILSEELEYSEDNTDALLLGAAFF